MFVNLTEKPIRVCRPGRDEIVISPDGRVASVVQTGTFGVLYEDIPVFEPDIKVVGLPDPVEGTFFVVHRDVARAMREKRSDVLYAGDRILENPILDPRGVVVAVTRLIRAFPES